MNVLDTPVLPTRRSYAFLNAYIHAASQEAVHVSSPLVHSFLVIEDDRMILHSIVDDLQERGFQARGLEDARDAAKILNQFRPSVLRRKSV